MRKWTKSRKEDRGKSHVAIRGFFVKHSVLDGFAIGASGVCLVHCLILPIILVALPGGSELLGMHDVFHVILLAIAIPTSLFALWGGKRRHGQHLPLLGGGIGLSGLLLGIIFEDLGTPGTVFTVVGSLILIAAHVTNWRMLIRLEQDRVS